VQLVAGPSGEARQAEYLLSDPLRLKQTLDVLSRSSHTLLLDCGAGVGPVVRGVAAESTLLLVVTTPDPAAMADAYALIKVTHPAIAMRRTPVILVVNQVTGERQADWVADRISSVARRFLGLDVLRGGFVRSDPHVLEAGRRRQPLVEAFPRSRAAIDVAALATRLDHLTGAPVAAGQCCA
jgi:flagellar biosynthesis protein FlhG